jgi:hypothetical protein
MKLTKRNLQATRFRVYDNQTSLVCMRLTWLLGTWLPKYNLARIRREPNRPYMCTPRRYEVSNHMDTWYVTGLVQSSPTKARSILHPGVVFHWEEEELLRG